MTGKIIRALRLLSAGLLLFWLVFGWLVTTWIGAVAGHPEPGFWDHPATRDWLVVAAILAALHAVAWLVAWLYTRATKP